MTLISAGHIKPSTWHPEKESQILKPQSIFKAKYVVFSLLWGSVITPATCAGYNFIINSPSWHQCDPQHSPDRNCRSLHPALHHREITNTALLPYGHVQPLWYTQLLKAQVKLKSNKDLYYRENPGFTLPNFSAGNQQKTCNPHIAAITGRAWQGCECPSSCTDVISKLHFPSKWVVKLLWSCPPQQIGFKAKF